ncbi:MAG: hypothetical protein WBQ75_17455 [Acetobacteraceae bacterium]
MKRIGQPGFLDAWLVVKPGRTRSWTGCLGLMIDRRHYRLAPRILTAAGV